MIAEVDVAVIANPTYSIRLVRSPEFERR